MILGAYDERDVDDGEEVVLGANGEVGSEEVGHCLPVGHRVRLKVRRVDGLDALLPGKK